MKSSLCIQATHLTDGLPQTDASGQRLLNGGVKPKRKDTKITGLLVMDTDGNEILTDPFGNNRAFASLTCGAPILAVTLENQRRWDEDNPAQCRSCETGNVLNIREYAKNLYIRPILGPE